MSSANKILVSSKKLDPQVLKSLIGAPFPDMVKFVVDIDRRIIAVGGQLHSDAEDLLIERECEQRSLWGGNYFPGLGAEECIRFTSLINIRPGDGNRSMNVEDPKVQARIRQIVFDLIGKGEALP